jgi:hypothetical protein
VREGQAPRYPVGQIVVSQVAELILAIVALLVLTLTTLALGLPAHL